MDSFKTPIYCFRTAQMKMQKLITLRKGVHRYFAKFTGKRKYQSLFFNKVPGLRPVTLLKKRLWYRCFPVNFAKISKNTFSREHLWVTASVA